MGHADARRPTASWLWVFSAKLGFQQPFLGNVAHRPRNAKSTSGAVPSNVGVIGDVGPLPVIAAAPVLASPGGSPSLKDLVKGVDNALPVLGMEAVISPLPGISFAFGVAEQFDEGRVPVDGRFLEIDVPHGIVGGRDG